MSVPDRGGKPKAQAAGAQAWQEDDDDDSLENESTLSFDEQEEEEEMPWIVWYCSLPGNEFFCEVDEEYIQDDFNLTGLPNMVPFFDHAIDMILDLETPKGQEDLSDEQLQMVESAAETLYGLIHARFITTTRGLKLMQQKYREGAFGRCPRVFCGGQHVLPVGQSDIIRESAVKLFCPKCNDIYYPRSSRHKTLEGAYWGTTFPHLLLLAEGNEPVAPPTQSYVPRIFGFRIRKVPVDEASGSGDGQRSGNRQASQRPATAGSAPSAASPAGPSTRTNNFVS